VRSKGALSISPSILCASSHPSAMAWVRSPIPRILTQQLYNRYCSNKHTHIDPFGTINPLTVVQRDISVFRTEEAHVLYTVRRGSRIGLGERNYVKHRIGWASKRPTYSAHAHSGKGTQRNPLASQPRLERFCPLAGPSTSSCAWEAHASGARGMKKRTMGVVRAIMVSP
jgi:hypothetical protein